MPVAEQDKTNFWFQKRADDTTDYPFMKYATYGVVNCTTSECDRVDWEGQPVKSGAWYDAELFKIGSLSVTAKEVGLSSGIIALLIFIGVCCCCFTCYKKKDDIEEGARRASTVLMNGARAIRNSIVGRPVDDPNAHHELPDPDKLGRDTNQRTFLKDLFDH